MILDYLRRKLIQPPRDYSGDYLTFIALEDGTFSFKMNRALTTTHFQSISYSLNGGQTWTTTDNVDSTEIIATTPLVRAGQKVLWKGSGTRIIPTITTYTVFSSTGNFRVCGNVMSILHGDDFVANSQIITGQTPLSCLFYRCTKLISSQDLVLPALDLTGTERAYYFMFGQCTSLTETPKLPATVLGSNGSYWGMFYQCTSLTKAPKLPAMTLGTHCYKLMFAGCTSLTKAPKLPATSSATYCYREMFSNCASLVNCPKINLTSIPAEGCMGMFSNCTKLANVPVMTLNATASISCQHMFYGCKALVDASNITLRASASATSGFYSIFQNCSNLEVSPLSVTTPTTLPTECFYQMFYNCAKLRTCFPEISSAQLNSRSCYNMFYGCAALTTAPRICAQVLGENSCYAMFSGCTSLNHIELLTKHIDDGSVLNMWTLDVSNTGTFVQNSEADWFISGPSGIPYGWTINYEGSSNTAQNTYNNVVQTATSKSLKMTALESGTITLNVPSYVDNSYCKWVEYSLDGGATWTHTDITSSNQNITTPTLSGGDEVIWRGLGNALSRSTAYYSRFSSTCNFNVSGNILSLVNPLINASFGYYAFAYLFYNCTKLINAQNLILEKTNSNSYCGMFQGCTSLTSTPELPATTLAISCYSSMFQGCTSLTSAPELPSKKLADFCYFGMFQGCTSLTSAPELPAATLAASCYNSMFQGCTSLTSAPELPATTLVTGCYSNMFRGCSLINYIKALFVTTPSTSYTNNWLKDVAASGSFVKNPEATWTTTGVHAVPTGWATQIDKDTFFTMEAVDSCVFTLTIPSGVTTSDLTSISYSVDEGSTWTTTNNTASDITITTPSISAGDKVRWKGVGTRLGKSATVYSTISSSGRYKVYGNIMTLLNKTSLATANTFMFTGLFDGSANLIEAGNLKLPAPAMGTNCYQLLFRGCTGLTTIPDLPATKLANYCYASMFSGCTSITTTPELPVKTLTNYCYQYMFNGCTSITTTSELPASSLTEGCYYGLFKNCTSITVAPKLPSMQLTKYGYQYMFQGCTGLTTAPALPAEALGDYAYSHMFQGCTGLTTAPALPATAINSYCYQYMFQGCTGLVSTPNTLPATTLKTYCYRYMFDGCNHITTAPILPAQALVSYCYQYMFRNCSSLNWIKAMFLSGTGNNNTGQWVSGVASSGTFVKNVNATWTTTGANGVPTGWTVETAND